MPVDSATTLDNRDFVPYDSEREHRVDADLLPVLLVLPATAGVSGFGRDGTEVRCAIRPAMQTVGSVRMRRHARVSEGGVSDSPR